MSTPPDTEREAVVDEYHGEEVVDPYRWLEGDGDRVEEWIDRQNEYADEYLETDTREHLRPEFESLARTTDYGTVVVRGGTYFTRIEGPDENHPRLLVREGRDGDWRVLVDPNEWDGASLDWYLPSPDGELVAYGVAEGGTENYDLRVIDLDGELVDAVDDAGRLTPFGIAWLEDGYCYQPTGDAGGGGQLEKELRRRLLDGTDDEIPADVDPGESMHLESAEDGTVVVGMTELSGATDLYVRPPGETDLQPAIVGEDATFYPEVHRGRVYLRTTHGAPNRRVLAGDVEQFLDGELDPADLDAAVPERDATLESFAPAGDHLVVHHQRDAHSLLSVYDPETGERVREVDLDGYVSVEGLSGNREAPEFFYRVEGFDRPPAVVRGDPGTGETSVVNAPEIEVESDLVVAQEWFESADGTEVPAFVVHREGIEPDRSNPAVVYGYGGFRINMTPGFRRFYLPFIQAGGVYVQAVLRGGAEFGEEWHEAGMRGNKQNVFDDFYAVAEGVLDRGYADPQRLAAVGGSNGGLLVGAALTQRPALWRAAVAVVPVLDMLRFHEFLLGEAWTAEYGSSEDPEAFEWLSEYSPYHNVAEREYPATLLRTAASDTRVDPAHARKMAVRLQANQTADAPVVLRTITETGHAMGKPTDLVVREQLDDWTFLFDRLGIDPGE